MNALHLWLVTFLLLAAGCWTTSVKPSTETTADKVDTGLKARDSANAASAVEIGKAAGTIPESPAKVIIEGEAGLIGARSGAPTKTDSDAAAARAAKAESGDPGAKAAYTKKGEDEAKERDRLQKLIEDLKKEAAAAKAESENRIRESESKMWSYIGATFVAVGMLITVACVYFRMSPIPGLLLVIGGVLTVATGRLLNSDLFMFAVGAIVIAIFIGVGWVMFDAWRRGRIAKQTKETLEHEAGVKTYTLAALTGKLDQLVFNDPTVDAELKKRLRTAFKDSTEDEHRAVIREARAEAVKLKI